MRDQSHTNSHVIGYFMIKAVIILHSEHICVNLHILTAISSHGQGLVGLPGLHLLHVKLAQTPSPGTASFKPSALGVCMPRGDVALHPDILYKIIPAYGKRVAIACG
eukprot:341219-Karenia_brevis.AAC.1